MKTPTIKCKVKTATLTAESSGTLAEMVPRFFCHFKTKEEREALLLECRATCDRMDEYDAERKREAIASSAAGAPV